MDVITVLSFTIFVATVVTIVMAAVSYGAFKIREWRRPGARKRLPPMDGREFSGEDTLFFKKYVPPPEESVNRDTRA